MLRNVMGSRELRTFAVVALLATLWTFALPLAACASQGSECCCAQDAAETPHCSEAKRTPLECCNVRPATEPAPLDSAAVSSFAPLLGSVFALQNVTASAPSVRVAPGPVALFSYRAGVPIYRAHRTLLI